MKQSLIFWWLIAPSFLLCMENTKEQRGELETFKRIKLEFCKINSGAIQRMNLDQQNLNLERLLNQLQSLNSLQASSRDSLSANIKGCMTTNTIMKKHIYIRDNKKYLNLLEFKNELRLNGLLD